MKLPRTAIFVELLILLPQERGTLKRQGEPVALFPLLPACCRLYEFRFRNRNVVPKRDGSLLGSIETRIHGHSRARAPFQPVSLPGVGGISVESRAIGSGQGAAHIERNRRSRNRSRRIYQQRRRILPAMPRLSFSQRRCSTAAARGVPVCDCPAGSSVSVHSPGLVMPEMPCSLANLTRFAGQPKTSIWERSHPLRDWPAGAAPPDPWSGRPDVPSSTSRSWDP